VGAVPAGDARDGEPAPPPDGAPAPALGGRLGSRGAVLQRGALASGFDTERWTLRRIARVLRREFGVTYHPHSLSALLGAHGWSPQRPAMRAVERDEALIAA
jgi:putative transposase